MLCLSLVLVLQQPQQGVSTQSILKCTCRYKKALYDLLKASIKALAEQVYMLVTSFTLYITAFHGKDRTRQGSSSVAKPEVRLFVSVARPSRERVVRLKRLASANHTAIAPCRYEANITFIIARRIL